MARSKRPKKPAPTYNLDKPLKLAIVTMYKRQTMSMVKFAQWFYLQTGVSFNQDALGKWVKNYDAMKDRPAELHKDRQDALRVMVWAADVLRGEANTKAPIEPKEKLSKSKPVPINPEVPKFFF